jgi:hypothetical protein
MMRDLATPLSYDKGRRPFGGWRDIRVSARILAEAIGITAIVATSLVVSLSLPPIVPLILGLCEGAIIGGLLRRTFRRARVRQPSFPPAFAVICAITSAVVICLGLYVREAYDIQAAGGGSLYHNLLGLAGISRSRNAFALISMVSRVRTGHGGFLGYLLFRFQIFPKFQSLLLGQTIISGFLIHRIARSQITAPFCTDCADWLGVAKNAAVVPTWLCGELSEAVRTNDPARAVEVAHQSADKYLGSACAIARYWRCPSCQNILADVIVKGSRIGQSTRASMIVTSETRVPPTVISEETLFALRTEPALPANNEADEAEIKGND